jgi:YegS/Rv2252/BmrU family lipid kinase
VLRKIRVAGEYHFIVNPTSGRRRAAAALQEALGRLTAAGCQGFIHTTTSAGEATTVAQALPDAAAVVAVGGDGTVREVAQGLLGGAVPLAILPAGTENLVAKELRFDKSPVQLVRTLLSSATREIDVGVVGHRAFLVVVGVGFDAEIVRRLSRRRQGHITHLDYFRPVWRTYWSHRFPRLRIVADGETILEDEGLVFVGNMPRYGLGLRILGDALVDDGLLDVCIFRCHRRSRLLLHAFRTVCGRHRTSNDVIYLRAREIHVSSEDPVPFEVDGDDGGDLPADIHLHSQKLQVLVPPVAHR